MLLRVKVMTDISAIVGKLTEVFKALQAMNEAVAPATLDLLEVAIADLSSHADTEKTIHMSFIKEALDESYDRGYADGSREGYADGSREGYAAGMEANNREIYDHGLTDGHDRGYFEGYRAGDRDGQTVAGAEDYYNGHCSGYMLGYRDGYNHGRDGVPPTVDLDESDSIEETPMGSDSEDSD